jgi:predicted hydrocarbon binding protein
MERSMRAAEVPPEMLEVFEKAKAPVKRYFDSLRGHPSMGRIEIEGDRFILARTNSLSTVLREVLSEIYGDRGSDQLLYSFGKAVGKSEARSFFERFDLQNPMERFGFGPTYFSYSGWAFVNLLYPSNPVPNENFLLVFSNQKSFEAESFLSAGEKTDKPICHINGGYLTGWCEQSFGIPLETRELFCTAQGDPLDLFIMTHRKRILNATERALSLINSNEELTVEKVFA